MPLPALAGGTSGIRYVDRFEGCQSAQQVHSQMLHAASAGRGKGQASRPGFCLGNELSNRVRWNRRMHDQHVMIVGNEGDRRETFHRVVSKLSLECGVQWKWRAEYYERVTVCGRLRGETVCDDAIRAGTIIENHGLSQGF